MEQRTIVQVVFLEGNGSPYSYFTGKDELQEDDHAIVKVKDTFKIVRVVKTKGLDARAINLASKWIVQKIDEENYKLRELKETLANEIRNKLEARRKEYEEMMIYKKLAQDDPEINKLLQDLEALSGDNLLEDKRNARS